MSKYIQLILHIAGIGYKNRRLRMLDEIDVIIKNASEKHPFECIKINFLGTENLVEFYLDQSVQ